MSCCAFGQFPPPGQLIFTFFHAHLSTGEHNAIYICAAPCIYKEHLPTSAHRINVILLTIL